MARGKNRLTAVEVRKAKPGRLHDGGGLVLEKTEHGGKWLWRYSIGKRRREMGLGSLEDVSLAAARRARDEWAGVLAQGLDPIRERQRRVAAEREDIHQKEPTFAEIAEITFEGLRATLREDGKRGRWWSPLRLHVIPRLGDLPISEIHQRDIYEALLPIWRSKHPTATKAIERTRIVLRKARLMGYQVDPFVVDAAREMLGAVRHEAKPIEATPWERVPELYARLGAQSTSALCLRWIILTVVRPAAARGARFSEIDEEAAIWTVPAERMKAREGKARPFRVPLSDEAMRVLEECRIAADSDLMFPGPSGRAPISDVAVSHTLNRRKEPGRAHGFRSSFRSWVQDTEAATYDVAETALGHVIGNRVERTYARSDMLEPRRRLMQKWAQHVTGQTAEVVQLRRG